MTLKRRTFHQKGATVWRTCRNFYVGALLSAVACSTERGTGTFSATISGAVPATVAGKASAEESTKEGPRYLIFMELPKKMPGMEQYQSSHLLISSPREISVGKYRALQDKGSGLPNNALHVDFGGQDELFLIADGAIQIEAGGRPASRSKGTFRLRFTRYGTPGDTITVAGQFDIR